MGSLYRPKLKSGKRSARYWVKYYVNGRAVRESTRTDDKETAKRFLKGREGAAATGQPVLPRVDRIRYDEVRRTCAHTTRRLAVGISTKPMVGWSR